MLLHFGQSLVAGSMNIGFPTHPQFWHSYLDMIIIQVYKINT